MALPLREVCFGSSFPSTFWHFYFIDKKNVVKKGKTYYISLIDIKGGGKMEVVVSPKYQVLIPKNIRKQINLKSGQKLQIIVKNGIISLIPDRPLSEFRGAFKGMDGTLHREEGDRV
jgi:AbrB family looped-hinge helix DNA binding protein